MSIEKNHNPSYYVRLTNHLEHNTKKEENLKGRLDWAEKERASRTSLLTLLVSFLQRLGSPF